MTRTRRLAGALLLSLLAGAAEAHTRSVSHGFWEVTGSSVEARVVIPLLEITRMGIRPETPTGRARAGEALMAALRVHDAEGVCASSARLPPEVRDGNLIHHWRVDCASPPRMLASGLFAGSAIAHTHFARLQANGEEPVSAVLSPRQPEWRWQASASTAPGSFGAFVAHGVSHILTGWDHLLFLLVLVVLARSLKEVVVLATGFTLGHSATLALAVLDIARPAAPAIEAFIALSIVLIALENGVRLDTRSRGFALAAATGLLGLAALSPVMAPTVVAGLALAGLCYTALLARDAPGLPLRLALTAAFGLFHGFGFAGELTALDLGPALLLPALLGFNLGVEAGQLLMLTAIWPLLLLLRRARLPAAAAASSMAAGIGVYWFVLRLFG
ncbi:HupE/UreJ family protein [Algiphilus aromaticivorans]|uniref:HupE/UreJ family protein n=1 Tax=Algiphilus aromaticivorans TaxID=382454 RepID=UPI0005C213A0|nr:HupE/UreJ family protein [Algiphilus aromaticivorans]